MTRRKLKSKSIKQKMIDELDPNKNSSRVPPEIVEEERELSPSKQRQLEALESYKWKPGQSGNPLGRPKDHLRAIGMNIAAKKARKILSEEEMELIRQLDMNPNDVTVAETIMVMLATSMNKDKLELFLDRTFGKVPNININAEVSAQLLVKFKSKLTDAELQRIATGEDVLDILVEKLPDVDGDRDILDSQFKED